MVCCRHLRAVFGSLGMATDHAKSGALGAIKETKMGDTK
jgi:hypothetical protein